MQEPVFKGAAPFFVADALTVAGLLVFPAIVLFLPILNLSMGILIFGVFPERIPLTAVGPTG